MYSFKNIGKSIIVICAFGILLFSAALVLAQETNSSTGETGNIKAQNVSPTSTDFSAKRQELLDAAKQRAQNVQEKLEQLRQQVQDKLQQKKEQIQQKLTDIKDEQKQKMAKQIVNQFDHINQVWTDHFTDVLNRLDAVLQKIQVRADKASANGQDITSVTAAIKSAQSAISAARTAVVAQAQKTYTVDTTAVSAGVSSSSTQTGQDQLIKNLRSQFKTAKEQLFKDLFALRDGAMKNAREAVKNAFKSLSEIPSVDKEPEASSTSPTSSENTNE